MKEIYKTLYKEILLGVRKSLAAGLIEVAKLIDLKEQSRIEDQMFIVEVANHFLSDAEEVRLKLLPNLCELISLFPEDK